MPPRPLLGAACAAALVLATAGAARAQSTAAVCDPDGLAALELRGLTPAFDGVTTAYRFPVPATGVVELTARACDASVSVYARGNPAAADAPASVWVGDGGAVDVVLYRSWREVRRYTLTADYTLPEPAPAPAVSGLDAPGLYPPFDPSVADYVAAPERGETLPLTVTTRDGSVRLFVQSVPVVSGTAREAWAPPGQVIDVVAYRGWAEVARYRVRALPGLDAWRPVPAQDAERDGATLVDSDELLRGFASGALEPRLPDAPDAVATRAAAEDAADTAALEAYFAAVPEARAALEALERSAPERDAGDRDTRTLSFRDRRGAERTVQVDSPAHARRSLARALRTSATNANALAAYLRLRAVADGTPAFPAGTLPDAAEATRLDAPALRALTRRIAAQADALLGLRPRPAAEEPVGPQPKLTGLPGRPCVGGHLAEYGSNGGADFATLAADDLDACTLSPDGVVANDTRPYTQTLDCVRDQGPRGTCVGFAYTSALESAFAASSGNHVNLSEQHAYARMKLDAPSEPNSGQMWDGLTSSEAVAGLGAQHFTTSLELGWRYNPSWARESIGDAGYYKYEKSCVGYGETCSDAPHQAALVCTRETFELLGHLYRKCAWRTQHSQWGVSLWSPGVQLWDAEDPHAAIGALKLALDAGAHVVMGLRVMTAFKEAVAGDGFVRYHGEDQSGFGGHAVHIVGYIDNSLLDTVAPGAPHGDYAKPGSGEGEGGYLIARNSWGPCAGDGGYLYLPYRYLKLAGGVFSATALYPDDVQWWQTK